jgi:RNA polymerase sigma-70 factor (sigma-E family)
MTDGTEREVGVDETVVSDPTPSEVIAEPAAGDAREFDAFVAARGSALLRTAYLLTADAAAAEDLLQDTLVRAWSRWSRVRRADAPEAYVRRMLVNASISRWRSSRSRFSRERLMAEPPDVAAPDRVGRDDELWRAVVALPPRQRAVLALTYFEDRADAEIAELLGCAVGTVKSQRAKALRTMRTRLDEEDR